MKIAFRKVRLSNANKTKLQVINKIIGEYNRQGLILTLRQLYYQLVSRDIIPNKVAEYDKLSVLLKEGRMGGIVDWAAIEDRLRKPESPNSWSDAVSALDTIHKVFALERQNLQPVYMEVWVEKDALSGVIERVTRPFHVPIMVNRGYSSVTAMYEAWQRFRAASNNGQKIRVIYLGDFDPSGRDMIRDIEKRICEFQIGHEEQWEKDETLEKSPDYWREFCADYLDFDFEIESVALTREQIELYSPPPNPAKITDPRAEKYIREHGVHSWEVDALRPEVLNQIVTNAIENHLDRESFDTIVADEEQHRKKLGWIKDNYDEIDPDKFY